MQPSFVIGLHSDFGTHASLHGPWKHVASATKAAFAWQVAESVIVPSAQPEQSLSPWQSLTSVQHEAVMQVSQVSPNQPVPAQLVPPPVPVLVVTPELLLVLVVVVVADDDVLAPPPAPPVFPPPPPPQAPGAKARARRPPVKRIHG
ncbi:MAG: hypothetical protein QM820_64225 [Minicystis sp.]